MCLRCSGELQRTVKRQFSMQKDNRKDSRNTKSKAKVIIAAACFLVLAAAVIFVYINTSGTETVVTEDVSVETVDMSRTVTAAGEVQTADEQRIAISTYKVFKAMCVEENEIVKEGQHIVMYSNGTYEDAPADGFIKSIKAPKSGNYAKSTNYVKFAASDKMAIDITVPEGEINEVNVGDEAEIVVNADTSKVYKGKIVKKKAMSTSLLGEGTQNETESSGFPGGSRSSSSNSMAYYTVRMIFDNDGTLLPGMSAVCTITISENKGVTAVPVEAVRFDSEGKSYVVVVDGNDTEDVYVTTGDSDAEYVEVKEGLESGQTVRIERKGQAK